MRKKVFVFSVFLLCLINLLSSQDVEVYFFHSKTNTLYTNYENCFKVYSPEIPDSNILITITNGEIWKYDEYYYAIYPELKGNLIMNIFQINQAERRLIETDTFIVKKLPEPGPYVANKPGGEYTVDELLLSPYITSVAEDINFDPGYKIHSYTFFYKNDKDSIISIPVMGCFFSDSVIEVISAAKPGDPFWIEDVIVVQHGKPEDKINIGSRSIRIVQ